MKMICILPVASDASLYVMMRSLRAVGVDVTVMAFERDVYPGKDERGPYISLGKIESGNFVRRIVPYLRATWRVRKALQDADYLFAFRGLDLLIFSWLARLLSGNKPPIIYNVADIHSVFMGNTARARLARWVDRQMARHVMLIVTTSEAFVTEYYHAILGMRHIPYHVIGNKVDATELPTPSGARGVRKPGHLRIGYFGLLRCAYSWSVLKRIVAASDGRISVYMRGVPQAMPDLDEVTQAQPAIEYGGTYVVPDELAEMYEQVDMVWVALRHAEANLRWSRVHRFYQACYFQKPIIAQQGTQDGKVVHEAGLGVLIDLLDPDEAMEKILNITEDDYDGWQANMRQLPASVHSLTDEYEQLLDRLNALSTGH